MALNPSQVAIVENFKSAAALAMPKMGKDMDGKEYAYDFKASFSNKGCSICSATAKTPGEAITMAAKLIGSKRPNNLTVYAGCAKDEGNMSSFSYIIFQDPSYSIKL